MACLLLMSGRSRQDIEMTLTQHMCETVAAGAVNQVRSRTIDLLPVVISVAEIIRDVDMAERQDDLMMRLDLRIQADLLSIACVFRGRLTHTEYLSLRGEGLDTRQSVTLSVSPLSVVRRRITPPGVLGGTDEPGGQEASARCP